MKRIRERMRRHPVGWFFAIAMAAEILVISALLFSGALAQLEAAIETVWGGAQRTDFVSAFRLALEAPQAIPGIALSILQPLTPDIAAFVVAGLAFGLVGVGKLVRGYRLWSGEVGRRRGLKVWGIMALTFVGMSLATAALDALFMPEGTWEWDLDVLSWGFPAALFVALFLDIGAVTEETGWRGFAQPVLQGRMTPLAAALAVGLLWGIWHFPARPDILLGGYRLGGGLVLLAILVLRFVVLSVVMAHFYNRAGGSTLIAIAMHGLHNDSVGLMGRITGEGLAPYVISELALLAPIAVVASWLLVLTRGRLGLDKSSEGRATQEVTPSYAPGSSRFGAA
jgi:membrane protease YdiL (CAAX protease family)